MVHGTMRVHDDGRGHKHPVLASNSSHHHQADSVFDTNILLSHAFCPSLSKLRYMYGLVTKKIASACIDYIIRKSMDFRSLCGMTVISGVGSGGGHGRPTFWQIEATPTNLLHATEHAHSLIQ